MCWQNVELDLVNVKVDGLYSYHCALVGLRIWKLLDGRIYVIGLFCVYGLISFPNVLSRA
jgi:hypothetical protein